MSQHQPPAMPPLGPPYAPDRGAPPPPTFPPGPPEDWPLLPPVQPAPVGPTPPRPPGRSRSDEERRQRAVIVAAIGAAAIVIIAVLVWGRSDGSGDLLAVAPPSTVATTEPDSSSDPTTTTLPALDATVHDIEAFVERERGLTFKREVDVHLADDTEFQRQLLNDFDQTKAQLHEEQDVLVALDLVPRNEDVVQDERTLLSAGVIGFYDPKTKALVVRSTEVTPFARQVLAHELTHALDDQWFNLDRPQLDTADDETGSAFSALAEGDARHVENAYLDSMSSAERAQASQEESQLVAQHPEVILLPPVLLDLAQFPYDAGVSFVQQVLDHGGTAALDQAFRQPPTTTEQILHPAAFLAGEGAAPVAAPNPDGTAIDHGVLGEFGFQEMLGEPAPGWGGDLYVTWTDASSRTCLRDAFLGDDATSTASLVAKVQAWAAKHDGTVDAPDGQPATLTVCH